MAKRDVEVDILGRDKTGPATRSAAKNFDQLDKRVKAVQKRADSSSAGMSKFGRAIGRVGLAVGRATSLLAALASTIGPATVALLAAAKGAVIFAKGLAAAAPAAATLPAVAGALGLIAGTFKLLTREGSSFNKAFEPITRHFVNAEDEASKFTKSIQNLAAKGIAPLAKQFVKVNFPAIDKAMERIAVTTNRIVLGTGKWLNSLEGQRLISQVSSSTAAAMEQLAPRVTVAAIALGRLANRAGDKAITGLTDLIGRILDKFIMWADSTSMADINQALSDLSGYFVLLKDKFDGVRDLGKWLGENEGKVRALSTALATFAVVVGALSLNPLAIIVGTLTLLALHYEKIKTAISTALNWAPLQAFGAWVQSTLFPVLQRIWQQALSGIRVGLGILSQTIEQHKPTLIDMFNTWKSFANFMVTRVLPIMGPILKVAFISAISAIAAVITIIVRLYQAWRAVSNATQAAIAAIIGATQRFVAAVQRMYAAVTGALARVTAAFSGMRSRVIGIFAGAAGWLYSAGRAIVDGLVNGIRAAAGRVAGAVGDLVARAKSLVPSGLGALFSGGPGISGWAPAQFAAQFAGGNFAAGQGGRTGGPLRVESSVAVNVALDGTPLRAMVTTIVDGKNKRQDWRNKVGKR